MSERRDFLIQAIADRERRKSEGVGLQAQETIDSEIQAFKAELEQLDAEETLAQKQEEHSGGLKDTIREIFDAIMPKEVLSKLIGLTEYDAKSQEFNQLIDMAVNEHNQTLFDHFGQEFERKDEKVRTLTERGMKLEEELQETNRKYADVTERINNLETENGDLEQNNEILRGINDSLNGQLDQKDREIENLNEQIKLKQEHIDQLRSDLANAPAPTASHINVTAQKSQTLTEKIQETKLKTQKEFDVSEIMKRFEDRQLNGGKVQIDLPSIGEPQGNTFQEDHPADNGTTNGVLPEESVSQFQEHAGVQDIQQGNEQADSGIEQQTMGTLAEAFERIAALEKFVYEPKKMLSGEDAA